MASVNVVAIAPPPTKQFIMGKNKMDETSNMKEAEQQVKSLETAVKKIANNLPYWAKYLAEKILSGNAITDKDIDTSYSYLLECLKLKEETEKPGLSISYNPNSTDDFKDNLIFKSLTNVEGVNALIENQRIDLTPKLTIIYGINGSGKSGYVRLFKNAFYSKHKEKILENVNLESGHKPVSAEFNFLSNKSNISLKYPDDSINGIFTQFAVYDGEIGKKHLRDRNDFSFRPAGLRLFNEFNAALEKLNDRLNTDIQKKDIRNPFAEDDIFQGESEIKTFLTSLSHNSNFDKLKKYLSYTEEEKEKKFSLEKKYDDLKIVLSQKDKATNELLYIKNQLATKKTNLEIMNRWFTQSQLDNVKTYNTDCKTKEETAQKEGINKFRTDKIKNIGSPEWKQFIEAAEKFSLTQSESGTQYPEIGDNCLLCHQPINEDSSKNLITSYWAYIKSVAERESKTAKEQLGKVKEDYKILDFNQFPETDTLSVWLKEQYEADLTGLKQVLKKQKILAQNVVSDIDIKEVKQQIEIQVDLSVLGEISKEIKMYEKNEQNKLLADILKQKTYLAHKEKLIAKYSDIEALYKNMIWVTKARKFDKQGIKTRSTHAEKRLSNEYFNSNYINAFNVECQKLNCKFEIKIDARSSDAQSNRKLFLKGKDPSEILSEGEQKAIALADFIAETNTTTINKGIIFDDPVNSLDEERKSVIAKRLIEISNDKQVIIFTHDLVFVSSLINFSTDTKLEHECHWIENRNRKPGYVWLKNAPSYEKVYRNTERVKEFYTNANKYDCPPEKREFYVKSGFTALRTCYEVLVINDLFKNVVQRFNERVSIDALSQVYFDETVVKDLLDSFAQCCMYMEGHTHSDKYAYQKPDPANLKEEINRFEAIKYKIKNIKKPIIG